MDVVYSKEECAGFYLVLMTSYTGTPTKCEIVPIRYNKVHGEAHTSHSFEITDYVLIENKTDVFVPSVLRDSYIFDDELEAVESARVILSKKLEENKRTYAELHAMLGNIETKQQNLRDTKKQKLLGELDKLNAELSKL